MEVQQQLAAVQQQLKKYAQQLGELNLANNQYQQANEALSTDIHTLTNKIAKKKHRIEQENKDKQIIHQKLVKAEKVKEDLEIRFTQIAERDRKVKEQQERAREQQERAREQQERAREQQERAREAERLKQAERGRKELMEKHSPIKIVEKPPSPQQAQLKPPPKHQQPVKQQKPTATPQTKPIAPVVQQVKPQAKVQVPSFGNSDKGQYQPPALFMESSDEQDEEDNSKTLEMLKSKLRMDSKELHDEDDD